MKYLPLDVKQPTIYLLQTETKQNDDWSMHERNIYLSNFGQVLNRILLNVFKK